MAAAVLRAVVGCRGAVGRSVAGTERNLPTRPLLRPRWHGAYSGVRPGPGPGATFPGVAPFPRSIARRCRRFPRGRVARLRRGSQSQRALVDARPTRLGTRHETLHPWPAARKAPSPEAKSSAVRTGAPDARTDTRPPAQSRMQESQPEYWSHGPRAAAQPTSGDDKASRPGFAPQT